MTMRRMITVHHLENSRSQRVLWLLEELGLEYDVVRYERDKKTMLAPPSLKKIHPLGKSPIVVDGEAVLVESGAIVEYLIEMHGGDRLAPPRGTPERLRYNHWMHYAEGSAMTPLLLKLIFNRVKTTPVPFFIKPITKMIADRAMSSFIDPQIALHFGYVESELAKREWFAGDSISGADIQMSFPLEGFAARGNTGPSTHPHITAWLERIHARPAYAKALERGGPFALGR